MCTFESIVMGWRGACIGRFIKAKAIQASQKGIQASKSFLGLACYTL